MYIASIAAFVWSLIVCVFAIPAIIKIALKNRLFDKPNERTVHERLIPRLGGVAIFAGFMSAFTIFARINVQDRLIQEIIAALIVLFFIGLKDDLGGTSVFKKFFVQVMATGIVVFFGGIRISSFYGMLGIYELSVGTSYLFTCVVILGITNAMNLIDGLDGLAGSITCLSVFSFAAYFFYYSFEFFTMALALLGAVLGFLRYNFKDAKIFMGDTGSLICGFLLSVFAIELIEVNHVPNAPNLAIAIIFIPIFDTIRVAVLRIFSGNSPFTPDQNHIHHVFVQAGLNQRQTVLVLLVINTIIIGIVASLSASWSPTILFSIILGYSVCFLMLLALIKRKTKKLA
ncbi:MAG: MraY family glycosyltransferase [Cyclobacteriaceae bacterium]